MAKDPAFLFYTGDFSTGTQFFTDEQVGKYIRLLLAQHQHGHLHEKHMLQICKTHDKDIFSKFIQDQDGLFYNQRLDNEIVKRKEYSKSRANNRKKNKDTSLSYVPHMENENKDINNSPISNSISIEQKQKIEDDMVVVEMMKIWMQHNPNYAKDTDSDYPALLQMAYKIAKFKGWKQADVVNFREANVLVSWEKIVSFVGSDSFLKNLAIKNLTNQFQMICQKMANANAEKADINASKKPKAKTRADIEREMHEWANS